LRDDEADGVLRGAFDGAALWVREPVKHRGHPDGGIEPTPGPTQDTLFSSRSPFSTHCGISRGLISLDLEKVLVAGENWSLAETIALSRM
jgi:hypothetical protein